MTALCCQAFWKSSSWSTMICFCDAASLSLKSIIKNRFSRTDISQIFLNTVIFYDIGIPYS